MPWKLSIRNLFGRVLVHGAEDEEEVPDAHAHLDAVGVAIAVVFGGFCDDVRLFGGLLGLAHGMFGLALLG